MSKVSFIIPCLNSEKTIAKVIEGVLNSNIPESQREIFIVDNGSSDRTIAIAKEFPVTILHCEKKGAGTARNWGAKQARGDYLCFIDSDTVVEPNWASQITKLMTLDSCVAGLGRVLPSGENSFLTRYRQKLADDRYAGTNLSLYHFEGISPIINTAACIFRRNFFEALGGFDERLSRYEDTEISHRLFNRGAAIVGTHHAVARVYNSAGPLAYLQRSFKLGLSRRELGALVGHDEIRSFQSLFLEFLAAKFRRFTPGQKIFYTLNFLFMLAGFIASLNRSLPKKLISAKGLRKKILSYFTISEDGKRFSLTGNTRVIIVDERIYFYSAVTDTWLDFDKRKIPGVKLCEIELLIQD